VSLWRWPVCRDSETVLTNPRARAANLRLGYGARERNLTLGPEAHAGTEEFKLPATGAGGDAAQPRISRRVSFKLSAYAVGFTPEVCIRRGLDPKWIEYFRGETLWQ
jgi:hypothetical protein